MELVDRVEALDKYRSRYLKNQAELHRSELFMRLLLLLPKNAFDKAVVMEKAGEELQQLNNLPLELARQPFEIEIIPYAVLWEVLLARL